MELFDKESKMNFILEELKKTDAIYNIFKKEFSEIIYSVINQYYPTITNDSELEELIHSYALEILSSTESVIDKDSNYPQYRLYEELITMNQLVLRLQNEAQYDTFSEAIHLKAKELMVKYYTSIFSLSANGFRLLEKNAKLYNWEFISSFNCILAAKVYC